MMPLQQLALISVQIDADAACVWVLALEISSYNNHAQLLCKPIATVVALATEIGSGDYNLTGPHDLILCKAFVLCTSPL